MLVCTSLCCCCYWKLLLLFFLLPICICTRNNNLFTSLLCIHSQTFLFTLRRHGVLCCFFPVVGMHTLFVQLLFQKMFHATNKDIFSFHVLCGSGFCAYKWADSRHTHVTKTNQPSNQPNDRLILACAQQNIFWAGEICVYVVQITYPNTQTTTSRSDSRRWRRQRRRHPHHSNRCRCNRFTFPLQINASVLFN